MKKNLSIILLLLFAAFKIAAQEKVFYRSGTYTVPTGVTKVLIEVVGTGGTGYNNGLSGGGGGGYASGIYEVTPGQVLTVSVDTANYQSTEKKTKVDNLIWATGGGNSSFTTDTEGFGIPGKGGKGSGGNIANYNGGNGGKGYYTYFGGGGGGAAGRNGNGGNGGDTRKYVMGTCADAGGAAGISGGFPGGKGSKGAGYLNCTTGRENWNPATRAENFGGGGGGGNGSGSPGTMGAPGWARITSCIIKPGITKIGLTLHANQENVSYQWVDASYKPVKDATTRSFAVMQPGSYAVILSNGLCKDTSDFETIANADFLKEKNEYGVFSFTKSGSFVNQISITSSVFIEVIGTGGIGYDNGLSGGGGGGYASGIYNLTPGQVLKVTVDSANYSGSVNKTKVGEFLMATGGTNASFVTDSLGFGIPGKGGEGSGGNIANFKGGDGGKGYWTYYGGGGGGAAGRNGNGSNGGDTKKYEVSGCHHPGGEGGESGGFPGGKGGKGAGFLNCSSSQTSPATEAGLYGAGGGGGNGTGSPGTMGAPGLARISYCMINLDVTREGNLLNAHVADYSYQWIKINKDSTVQIIAGANSASYELKPGDEKIAVYISDGVCSGISDRFSLPVATGTYENSFKSDGDDRVTIYPNPAKEIITVNAESENEMFKICNLEGQLLLTEEVSKTMEVNVGGLQQGIYFYQLGEHKGKLIIE
jgi:hypothetical protein